MCICEYNNKYDFISASEDTYRSDPTLAFYYQDSLPRNGICGYNNAYWFINNDAVYVAFSADPYVVLSGFEIAFRSFYAC